MFRGVLKLVFLKIFILVMTSCYHSSESSYQESDLIAGGKILETDSPFLSSVVLLKSHSLNPRTQSLEESDCTGSLIFDEYVLTAAHCVDSPNLVNVQIYFPLTKISVIANPKQVIRHPEYSSQYLGRSYENLRDIALIELESPIQSPLKSLQLLPYTLISIPAFQAMGFGQTQGSLLKKEIKTYDLRIHDLHAPFYDPLKPYFKAQQPQGGICFGDSGGPAMTQLNGQDYLLGIAVDVVFNPSRAFEVGYDRCRADALFLNLAPFHVWLLQRTGHWLAQGRASHKSSK